jgi:hypothetical protein
MTGILASVTRYGLRSCLGAIAVIVATLGVAACGSSVKSAAVTGVVGLHPHPQVIQPVAGAMPSSDSGNSGADASGSSGNSGEVSVSQSGQALSTKPATTEEVEQELNASGINPNPDRATLTANGLAIPPANAPAPVVAAILAGNQIAHNEYTWGGGHATYEDTGYDCSGSLSFILAAAGLLTGTETSGEFMSFGQPGQGKWISIYAMNGHTFAIIAGLRFDTVALAETGTRWSNRPPDEPNLSSFVARHPAGL